MTQTIYVDILVIINIYIGYLLLSTAGFFAGVRAHSLRLLASSLLQGAGSLVIFLPTISMWLNLAMRAAMCALFVFVAYGYGGKRQFLRLCISFLGVSVGFAGIMSALWFFFAPGGMAYNNGTVYFNIDALMLAVITVVCYCITRIVFMLARRRSPPGRAFVLQVTAFDRQVKCGAIVDTGNTLKDCFTGLPVIIISREVAKNLLGEEMPMEIDDLNGSSSLPRGFRLIPCGTACGGGLLIAFRPKEICLSGVDRTHISTQALVAFSATNFGSGEAQALVGEDFFRNSEEVIFSVGSGKDEADNSASEEKNIAGTGRRCVLCQRTGKSAGSAFSKRGERSFEASRKR